MKYVLFLLVLLAALIPMAAWSSSSSFTLAAQATRIPTPTLMGQQPAILTPEPVEVNPPAANAASEDNDMMRTFVTALAILVLIGAVTVVIGLVGFVAYQMLRPR